MCSKGLILYLIIFSSAFYYVQPSATALLSDLTRLIPPCSARELVQVLPKDADVAVYFHDRESDGSYIFGYILESGERRYEQGIRYNGQLYVFGFYSHRKYVPPRYVYETTWYTAGKNGYYPTMVEVTYNPPKIPDHDSD